MLQYLLGFQRLGHTVYLVEPISRKDLQPTGSTLPASLNAAYFRGIVSQYGLEDRSALVDFEREESVGLSIELIREKMTPCDVLINLAGLLSLEDYFSEIPVKVYLDIDPGFTQLWSEVGRLNLRFEGHTHFVTIGLRIGAGDCLVPTCGLDWLTTLQPVVLDFWPVSHTRGSRNYTSIGNWRSYGSVMHKARLFGQKVHSWRHFIQLPRVINRSFVIALSIHPKEEDFERLKAAGWILVDPIKVAGTPSLYRDFIRGSRAELGIAKSGYVLSKSGWFSERSACYLAAGRPVIAQNTGFSEYLPCGEGLFCFDTTEDILESIHKLDSSYPKHCKAARSIAEEFFDSGKVLPRLLTSIGV